MMNYSNAISRSVVLTIISRNSRRFVNNNGRVATLSSLSSSSWTTASTTHVDRMNGRNKARLFSSLGADPPIIPSSTTTTTTNDDDTTSTNRIEPIFDKIAFLGGGMIAQAIMEPMIKVKLQPASNIMVYDVNLNTMTNLQKNYGVQIADNIAECINNAKLIICAVKPQNLTKAFFTEIQKGIDELNNDAIFLSVIAGKSMDVFEDNSGFNKIVRSMPNTPATIGQGMTVWSCTPNITADERKKIRQVLSSCGKSMYVDDESYIDMATSISGSGPAYVFMLMEAMIDAGVHMGFPREKATTLVYHTMLGSTLYAMEAKEHPAILRNRVTSPGGTTASALYELENGRFRTVIKNCMWSCYRRSLEMGNHDSNVGPGRAHQPDPIIRLTTDSDEESDNDDNNNNNHGFKIRK